MMRVYKRVMAALLTLCLAFSMLPMSAFATDTSSDEAIIEINGSAGLDQTTKLVDISVLSPEIGETEEDVSTIDANVSPEETQETEPDEAPTVQNACGDALTWSIEGGTLYIHGYGPMYDYIWHVSEDLKESTDAPWFSQREEITRIVLEEGVTYVGTNAFAACCNVVDVMMANSVYDFGEGAFEGVGPDWDATPIDEVLVPQADPTSGNVRYAVLVLDVSGSMASRPMTAQKSAAVKFCESILAADGSNYVAVVTFDTSVKVVCQFSDDLNALTEAINKIRSGSSTNTVNALAKADELLSATPDTAGRSIVLCSDGLPNVGTVNATGPFTSSDSSYYYQYANVVYDKSIELMQKYDLFTLGFFHSLSGNDLAFAQKFMPTIQNAGYYEVTNPDDLEFTFGDIAGDVVTPGHSGIIFVSVPEEKYVIHVVNDKGQNLPNANVTCNGTSAKTNNYGIAQFDRTLFVSTPTITVTASGYQEWTNASSNWTFDNRGYATIKIYPTATAGYQLSECAYSNNADMSLGVNLLVKTKTVSLGNDLPVAGDLDFGKFYLTCKANKTDGVDKYELWQNAKKIKECIDGNFGELSVDTDGFVEGGKCFIRVVTADGQQVDTNINLQFKKHDINKNTEITFNGGGHSGDNSKISFKVGDNVPFIGGSTFTLDLPVSSHITFLLSPDGKKVQLGLNFADLKDDNEHKTTQEQFDAAKKLLTDARTAANLKAGKLDNQQKRTFYSLLKGNSKKWTFFKDGEWNFLGYAEGDFDNNTAKGHVMLQYSVTAAELGFTTWVVVVPVTVQVGLDLEGNLIGEIGYDWANAQFIGSLDFDAAAKLKAFGGVGVGKAIGAGAYGSAKLEGEFRIIGTPWGLRSIDLTGELGVKAYLAWLTYERPFAKNTWHLYTGNNVRSISNGTDANPMMADLYDASSYKNHDLSYLSEESEWMGMPIMLLDASAGTTLSSVLDDTYRNAQPVMVSANDVLYAAFLRADQETGKIYTAVTKFDGSSWAKPVRVDQNAIMDGMPSLCVGADGTIWLTYSKTATDCNMTSLTDYAQKQSIVVGSIDPNTLAFSEVKSYAGTGYAHLQQIALTNGKPTLVWADSTVIDDDDDSVLWPKASKLYMATFENGRWSEAQKMADVSMPVLQLAAGVQNGSVSLAYVADKDCDPETVEDQNLYHTGSGTALANNVQGKLTYTTLPGNTTADFVWNADNCLKTAGGNEIPAEGITREYAVTGNRIYYSAADIDGNGAHLTTVIYDQDSWSGAVTLTGGERYLENVSVVKWGNNDYVMGMDTLATIADNNVTDAKNLVFGQIKPTSNLCLDSLDYNPDGLTAGTPVPVTVSITNAGDHVVNSVDISVNNGTAVNYTCDIAPGASADLTFDVICPAELINYSFEVIETSMDDFIPEDNTATIGIGYADLDVKVEEERVGEQSSLVVYVTNKGVAPASGIVTINNADGNQIQRIPFTNLKAGETFVASYPMKDAGVYTASAALSNNVDDLYTYNNSDAIRIGDLPHPTTYVITFDANGGELSGNETLITGQDGMLSSLPTPTRSSYNFDGWYTLASGGEKISTSYVFTADTTVYAHWSSDNRSNSGDNSSPGSTTYTVSMSKDISHGKVTVSPKSAEKGRTVTLTVTPDEGYELDKLIVTDKDGKELNLTNKGDGKYTFTMPDGNATVNAMFQLTEKPWSNPFTDVTEGAWYFDAVKFVNQNGLMNGVGNGLFVPNTHLSRAMLAQILYNKEGRPAVTAGSTFTDIQSGAWYADAVTWAATKNIVSGYGNDLFGPGDDITREQFAVILYRYAGSPTPPNLLLDFTDAYEVSDWAQDAIRWAVEQGILKGKGNGILDPTGKATRAEAAQMLKNYFGK